MTTATKLILIAISATLFSNNAVMTATIQKKQLGKPDMNNKLERSKSTKWKASENPQGNNELSVNQKDKLKSAMSTLTAIIEEVVKDCESLVTAHV